MKKHFWPLYLIVILPLLISGQDNIDTNKRETGAYFPGGLDSLYLHLENNFRMSRTDMIFVQGEELIADLKLTINKKGQVVNIVHNSSLRIEYEMERAFMAIPPFVPAMSDGKPVTSYVDIKFIFVVQGNQMAVVDHLYYNTHYRDKQTGWIKAALIAGAVILFLILI